MFQIQPQRPADAVHLDPVLDRAFGPDRLAKASYQFRQGVEPIQGLSLVAYDGDTLVGTIRYWPVRIGAKGTPALLLGPLAVEPVRRGEGIGVTLVTQSLAMAKLAQHRIVLLVGGLDYYGRFGFQPAAPLGLFMPREKPERLLVSELVPGALDGVSGELRPRKPARRRGVESAAAAGRRSSAAM